MSEVASCLVFGIIDQKGNLLYCTMQTPWVYWVEIKCVNEIGRSGSSLQGYI